jgi:hypothetical protein
VFVKREQAAVTGTISMRRRFPLRRKISLVVLTTFLAALGVIINGCSRPGPTETDPNYDLDEREDSISFDLNNPKLKERLGDDNGYAFAILYGADIHGSLETCG